MDHNDDQLTLLEVSAESAETSTHVDGVELAPTQPVASVLLERSVPHLDRLFDYVVTAEQDHDAQPGVRVRVRFSGQLVDGLLVSRSDTTTFDGVLRPLHTVVSSEVVLRPDIVEAMTIVAEHNVGVLADLARLAVVPRHARTEKTYRAATAQPPGSITSAELRSSLDVLSLYPAGHAFRDRLAAGDSPRAVWTVAPAQLHPTFPSWVIGCIQSIVATVTSGRSALIVVPDARDVDVVMSACDEFIPTIEYAVFTADLGPSERYAQFLRASRGDVSVVIGTRSAVWAPLPSLGLIAVWDDGDDSLREPRAPYPAITDIVRARCEVANAAALLAGHGCSMNAVHLVETQWARSIVPARQWVRRQVPLVQITGGDFKDPDADWSRLPLQALEIIKRTSRNGVVLVHVPRVGYVPLMACARCRHAAQCLSCRGPLQLAGRGHDPFCRWCGKVHRHWACPVCDSTSIRAIARGVERTAEEFGRMFPGNVIVALTSQRDSNRAPTVPAQNAIVLATPGLEPVIEGGYAAVVLLDTHLTINRPQLNADVDALRVLWNAMSHVRGGDYPGEVVVVGDRSSPPLQAMVRHDPLGFAGRAYRDRLEANLPPAVFMAEVTGASDAVTDLAKKMREVPATVLGPTEIVENTHSGDRHSSTSARVLVSAEPEHERQVRRALAAARARISLDYTMETLPKIKVNPMDLH